MWNLWFSELTFILLWKSDIPWNLRVWFSPITLCSFLSIAPGMLLFRVIFHGNSLSWSFNSNPKHPLGKICGYKLSKETFFLIHTRSKQTVRFVSFFITNKYIWFLLIDPFKEHAGLLGKGINSEVPFTIPWPACTRGFLSHYYETLTNHWTFNIMIRHNNSKLSSSIFIYSCFSFILCCCLLGFPFLKNSGIEFKNKFILHF